MRRNKSVLLILVAILAISLLAVGCGGNNSEAPPANDGGDENDLLKVVLILPGKIDDVSWNQAMYEGVKELEEEYKDKIVVTYVEEVYEVADIEPALMDFASEGYDLIFGHGFQFMEPIIKVGEQFPDVSFALGTGYKTLPNTSVYDVHLQDGGYIMGTLAALMSETGKIGVIGGADVSEIFRGHEAFKYAAKQINPDIEIQELYTGDWRDAAKAKEGAISMYESGVDIIWHSGDGIGLGTVDAAREQNKLVMGNVADQNVLAPNNVLSGIVYEWQAVAKQIVDEVLAGTYGDRDEKFYWLTVENGGVAMAPYHGLDSNVPDEVKAHMEEVLRALANNEIEMPDFDK